MAYTKRANKLTALANEYYVNSDGVIKTVLTLRVLYFQPAYRQVMAESRGASFNREATFCLYRSSHRIQKDVKFRGALAQSIDSGLILLCLTDIPPYELLEGEDV